MNEADLRAATMELHAIVEDLLKILNPESLLKPTKSA